MRTDGEVTKFTQLKVVLEDGDWLRVELPTGKSGWIRRGWVGKGWSLPNTPGMVMNARREPIVLRSAPDFEALELGAAWKRTPLTVLIRSDAWSLVRTEDGVEGWVLNGEIIAREEPKDPVLLIPNALVIGIDEYADLPRLTTAVNDAKAVGQILESAYGYEVTPLYNPTRAEIIRELEKFRKLTEHDTLLLYYAGHGEIDNAARQGFWQPADATPGSTANWLRNGTITTQLHAIKAKHILVVADSCYSGTLIQEFRGAAEIADEVAIRRFSQKLVRKALVSGGLEPVLGTGGGGHSVFARAFIDALKKNDGVITGNELLQQIRPKVVAESNQTPNYAPIAGLGDEGGDFLFVRKVR